MSSTQKKQANKPHKMPMITDWISDIHGDRPDTYYVPNTPLKVQLESKSEKLAIDFANMRDPFQRLHISSSIFAWKVSDTRIKLTKIGVLETPAKEWRNDTRIKTYKSNVLTQDIQQVEFTKDEYIMINNILIDVDAMQVGDALQVRFFEGQTCNSAENRTDIIGRHNTIVRTDTKPPVYEE